MRQEAPVLLPVSYQDKVTANFYLRNTQIAARVTGGFPALRWGEEVPEIDTSGSAVSGLLGLLQIPGHSPSKQASGKAVQNLAIAISR